MQSIDDVINLGNLRAAMQCVLEGQGITFVSDDSDEVLVSEGAPRWLVQLVPVGPATRYGSSLEKIQIAWGDDFTLSTAQQPDAGWTMAALRNVAQRIGRDYRVQRGLPIGQMNLLAQRAVLAICERYAKGLKLLSQTTINAILTAEVLQSIPTDMLDRVTANEVHVIASIAMETYKS